MIARRWSARVRASNLDAYESHFKTLVMPELSALSGFLGASIMRRDSGGDDVPSLEIVVETRWQSMEAIRSFAGNDVGAAVVEPAAAAVLEEYDRRVTHFEVIADL